MVYGLPFLVVTAHVWGNWQRVQTAATHGFTINGDLVGFFNDYIGLGAFANYRQYSEADVSCWIMVPNYSFAFTIAPKTVL